MSLPRLLARRESHNSCATLRGATLDSKVVKDWVSLAIGLLTFIVGAALAIGRRQQRRDAVENGLAKIADKVEALATTITLTVEKLDAKIDHLAERMARMEHIPTELERVRSSLSRVSAVMQAQDAEIELLMSIAGKVRRARPRTEGDEH